jgi:hypothetical protein
MQKEKKAKKGCMTSKVWHSARWGKNIIFEGGWGGGGMVFGPIYTHVSQSDIFRKIYLYKCVNI